MQRLREVGTQCLLAGVGTACLHSADLAEDKSALDLKNTANDFHQFQLRVHTFSFLFFVKGYTGSFPSS